MKATGIVRRIDDLGRVVIPKEIRRTLRIREGDPLEIYTDRNGEVILKKYSPIGELGNFAQEYSESLSQTAKTISLICDRDNVIAASGSGKKDFMDKKISFQIEKIMQQRKSVSTNDGKYQILAQQGEPNYDVKVISPIIAHGDPIGAVILLGENRSDLSVNEGMLLTNTGALFLGKQMEQ